MTNADEGTVEEAASAIRESLAEAVFTTPLGFSLSSLRSFASGLRSTDLPRRYATFKWFADAADTTEELEDAVLEFLYQVDQRLNLDEEFEAAAGGDPDRRAILFAMSISFAGRFLSASLDPVHRRVEPTESALRAELEMAIKMAEASATGCPPPRFG